MVIPSLRARLYQAWPLQSRVQKNRLAAQEVKHKRQHDRNHEASDDREVKPAAFALDTDIARQPPEAQLRKPRPREACEQQHRADEDERALHPADSIAGNPCWTWCAFITTSSVSSASKRHSCTRFPWPRKGVTLTPSPSQVAPSGKRPPVADAPRLPCFPCICAGNDSKTRTSGIGASYS
jgi:hypothetical protein